MSLRTASLIALIGAVAHLFLSFSIMATSFFGLPFGLKPYMIQLFWLFNLLIFNGSLILFLAVFYAKQKP
jgi:hypothetical protein